MLANQIAKFNMIKLLNQIMFINMLQSGILGIPHIFFIIKCVSLKPIIFTINLDIASSSKVFSIFYFMFLPIVLLIYIN